MVAVASVVSPADYEAFAAAAGVPYPKTAAERAELAPLVLQWKRERSGQSEPAISPAEAAVGTGILGAASAGGYLLWDQHYRQARKAGASPQQAQDVASQAVATAVATPQAEPVPAAAPADTPTAPAQPESSGLYPEPGRVVVDSRGRALSVTADKEGNLSLDPQAVPAAFFNKAIPGDLSNDYSKLGLGFDITDREATEKALAAMAPAQRDQAIRAIERLRMEAGGKAPGSFLPDSSQHSDSLPSASKDQASSQYGYIPRQQRPTGTRPQQRPPSVLALLREQAPDLEALSGGLERSLLADEQSLVSVPRPDGRGRAVYPVKLTQNAEFHKKRSWVIDAIRDGKAQFLATPAQVASVYEDAQLRSRGFGRENQPRPLDQLLPAMQGGDIDFAEFLSEAIAGQKQMLERSASANEREIQARKQAVERARKSGTGEELAAAKARLAAVQTTKANPDAQAFPVEALERRFENGTWSTEDVDAAQAATFYRDRLPDDSGMRNPDGSPLMKEVLVPYVGRRKDGTVITLGKEQRLPVIRPSVNGLDPVVYTGMIGGEGGRPIADTDLVYLPPDDLRHYGYELRKRGVASVLPPGSTPVQFPDGAPDRQVFIVPVDRPAGEIHPIGLNQIAINQLQRAAARGVYPDENMGREAEPLVEPRPQGYDPRDSIPYIELDELGNRVMDPANPALPKLGRDPGRTPRVLEYGVLRQDAGDRVEYFGGVPINDTGFLAEPNSRDALGLEVAGLIEKTGRLPSREEMIGTTGQPGIARRYSTDPQTALRAGLLAAQRLKGSNDLPGAPTALRVPSEAGVALPERQPRAGKPSGVSLGRKNTLFSRAGDLATVAQEAGKYAALGEAEMARLLQEGNTDAVKHALLPRVEAWSRSSVTQASRVPGAAEDAYQETALSLFRSVDDLSTVLQKRPELLQDLKPGAPGGHSLTAVLKGMVRRDLTLAAIQETGAGSPRYTLAVPTTQRLAYAASQAYPDLPLEEGMKLQLDQELSRYPSMGAALMGLENPSARVHKADPDDPGWKADRVAELLFTPSPELAELGLHSQKRLSEVNPSQVALNFAMPTKGDLLPGYADVGKPSVGRLQPSVDEVIARVAERAPTFGELRQIDDQDPMTIAGVSPEAAARMTDLDGTALRGNVSPERQEAMLTRWQAENGNSELSTVLDSYGTRKRNEPPELTEYRQKIAAELTAISDPGFQARIAEAVSLLNQGVTRGADGKPLSQGQSLGIFLKPAGAGALERTPRVGIGSIEAITPAPLDRSYEADNVAFEQRSTYGGGLEGGAVDESELARGGSGNSLDDVLPSRETAGVSVWQRRADLGQPQRRGLQGIAQQWQESTWPGSRVDVGDALSSVKIENHPAFGPIKSEPRAVPVAPWAKAREFGLVGFSSVQPVQGQVREVRDPSYGRAVPVDAPTEIITSEREPSVGTLLNALREGIPSSQRDARFLDVSEARPKRARPAIRYAQNLARFL